MKHLARNTQQLGSILRRERRRSGLSQQDIGNTVRIRQATISKLESGSPHVQLKTLFLVLTALDLELVLRPRTKGQTKSIEDIF